MEVVEGDEGQGLLSQRRTLNGGGNICLSSLAESQAFSQGHSPRFSPTVEDRNDLKRKVGEKKIKVRKCPYLHKKTQVVDVNVIELTPLVLDVGSTEHAVVDGTFCGGQQTALPGVVEVHATGALRGHTWNPYQEGAKVETCGILDSAAQLHNAPVLDSVDGQITVTTVHGAKDADLGTAQWPTGQRDTVRNRKAIWSVPQSIAEGDLVGYSNFTELPDEFAIGPAVYYRDAFGALKSNR